MLAMRDGLQKAGFRSKAILVAGGLGLLGAGAVGMTQPASASTISLTDSWTEGTATHQTGSLPTLSTTANQSTSNLGTVSPISNPKTQSLAQGVATSGEVLFVAVPNGYGTNEADIPITFTLSDGIGSVMFTDYINYYANFGTDTDDLAWSTSPASSPGYLSSGSLVQSETLSDGVMVQVQLPYETDWNMGQQITFDYTGNNVPVPEPATMTLLASGLVGLGLVRRRRAGAALCPIQPSS